MLTNQQMKAGRFERWHKARKLAAKISAHLIAGGAVAIGSHTRPRIYRGAAHVESFRAGRDAVYVRRGKNWDSLIFSPIHFA